MTVVVERDAPSASAERPKKPREARTAAAPAFRACDSNIEVRAETTTCEFAQNVFWVYWTSDELTPIAVYSPAAGESLLVRCRDDGVSVECSSGDDSRLRFSRAALDAYSQAQATAYAAAHDLGPDPHEWDPYAYELETPDEYLGDYSSDPYSNADHHYSGRRPRGDDGITLPGENIPNYERGRGYRVRCNDGTYSRSGGIQGACSHHGGVAR